MAELTLEQVALSAWVGVAWPPPYGGPQRAWVIALDLRLKGVRVDEEDVERVVDGARKAKILLPMKRNA